MLSDDRLEGNEYWHSKINFDVEIPRLAPAVPVVNDQVTLSSAGQVVLPEAIMLEIVRVTSSLADAARSARRFGSRKFVRAVMAFIQAWA